MRTVDPRTAPAVLLLALCAGCGQATAPASAPAAVTPAPVSAAATPSAQAAPTPSLQAQMVCQPEARGDIAAALGVDATTVGPLRYAAGTTTCRYAYPRGGFTLTVQDLPDPAATAQAYDELGQRMGHGQDMDLEGARAFTTSGGSVVMQKDTKVLLVDVTDLPDPFGRPPAPRPTAALLVTKAILNCWSE